MPLSSARRELVREQPIGPGALVTKDVPPYTAVGCVPAKRLGPVPKSTVDYELFVKRDFETATVMRKPPPSRLRKAIELKKGD